MFVAISRFLVKNGMESEVREAFRARPHQVDGADGFIRMEVLTPRERSAEFWLLTFWEDESSFRSWHGGHTFKESHSGIPKGLKLDPGETELRFFDHVSS